MKSITTLLFFSFIMLVSCKMDPPYISYSNVGVPITSKTIPETGTVSQPLTITGVASAPDGCWKHLRFVLTKREDFRYDLYALGSYESYGVCPQVEVVADTVITFVPEAAGEYVITTLVSPPLTIETDTITVTVAGK